MNSIQSLPVCHLLCQQIEQTLPFHDLYPPLWKTSFPIGSIQSIPACCSLIPHSYNFSIVRYIASPANACYGNSDRSTSLNCFFSTAWTRGKANILDAKRTKVIFSNFWSILLHNFKIGSARIMWYEMKSSLMKITF